MERQAPLFGEQTLFGEKTMKVKTRWILLALGVVMAGTLLACSNSAKSVSDREISLRKESLDVVTNPRAPVYSGKEPGENKKFKRAFYGAPPMIPHSMEDSVVGAKSNDCLDCHGEGDEETPGISPSHSTPESL